METYGAQTDARYERYRKGVAGSADLTPWVSLESVQKGVAAAVGGAREAADDVGAGLFYLWDEVIFRGM